MNPATAGIAARIATYSMNSAVAGSRSITDHSVRGVARIAATRETSCMLRLSGILCC